MDIVYSLYYSASLHVWKFLIIGLEWKKFKIIERMSWVNEAACLQVLERELNDQLPRWTLARGGAPPRPVPRVVPGACAPLPGNPGRGAPCARFRTASLKKSNGAPGCQARSIKAAGAQRRKGPVCIPKTQKPLSRHSDSRRRGERELKLRFNSVGSQAVGAPSGQKGLSAGEEAAPGPGGSIKGSCVPTALKFTFVFWVQVKGRLQKEPAGSPPSSGIWW